MSILQEGLQPFAPGFAPEVAVLVAQRAGMLNGSDPRDELGEIPFNLVLSTGEASDAELVADANVIYGEANWIKHGEYSARHGELEFPVFEEDPEPPFVGRGLVNLAGEAFHCHTQIHAAF